MRRVIPPGSLIDGPRDEYPDCVPNQVNHTSRGAGVKAASTNADGHGMSSSPPVQCHDAVACRRHSWESYVASADLFWEQGDVKQAIVQYKAALVFVQQHSDTANEEVILLGFAYVLFSSGDIEGAVMKLRRALTLATERGASDAQKNYITVMLDNAEKNITPGIIEKYRTDMGKHGQCSEAIAPGDLVIVRWTGRCTCMGDSVSLATVEAFLPQRGRWSVRLANGQCCAALPSHLTLAPFAPYQRVQVNDHPCPLVIGTCGVVVGYNQVGKWVVNLDIGFTVEAHASDLLVTKIPRRTCNLRQLQKLALVKVAVSTGSSAFGVPIDLIESISEFLTNNAQLAVWARYVNE